MALLCDEIFELYNSAAVVAIADGMDHDSVQRELCHTVIQENNSYYT
jgi:hypothetical protein